MAPSRSSTVLAILMYTAGGIMCQVGQQKLAYLGAGDGRTFIPNWASYGGMALCGLLPVSGERVHPPHRAMAILACLDVVAQTLSILGIQYAGSGLFTVVSSSSLVFSVVISRVFLGRVYTWYQVLACAVVMAGLSASQMQGPGEAGAAVGADEARQVTMGVLASLVSALVFAVEGVVAEGLLSEAAASSPPQPEMVAGYLGAYALAVSMGATAVYAAPRWDALVTGPVAAAGSQWGSIYSLYVLTLGASVLLNLGYYKIMAASGIVVVGVTQAFRSVLVFGVSAQLFCEVQASQCFTAVKALSALIVAAGVVMYNMAPAAAARKNT